MTADHHPIDSREADQITWQIRAEIALESTIQARQCLNHAALAETARIPAPHRIHKLTGWLEVLITRDHHAGKPLRAAAVISRRRNGVPAPGFLIDVVTLAFMMAHRVARRPPRFTKNFG